MAAPATNHSLPTSPSLSATSSFDMLSSLSVPSQSALHDFDDEDQIVWSIAGSTGIASSTDSDNSSEADNNSVDNSTDEDDVDAQRSRSRFSVASDDDFVVLSRPRSRLEFVLPVTVAPVSDLVSRISRMALNASSCVSVSSAPIVIGATAEKDNARARRAARRAAAKDASTTTTTTQPSTPAKKRPSKPKKAKAVEPPVVLPQRTATVTPLRLGLPAASVPPPEPVKPNNKPSSRKRPSKVPKKSKQRSATPTPATPSVAESPRGLGERPIVKDDVSEFGDTSAYEEASNYISTFLSSKAAQEQTPRLALLHALIIELNLLTPSSSLSTPAVLPPSLKQARALLKSRVHINIREYIAAREQGPDALQAIMHPTRRALIKSLRERRNTANLRWVKDNGLQVLLVNCF